MQHAKPTILCTGPVDLSAIDNNQRQQVDIDVSLFTTVSTSLPDQTRVEIQKLIDKKANVVFTSSNALHAIAGLVSGKKPGWTVFCLGNSTYELAKKIFGEMAIHETASNAAALAHRIIAGKKTNSVVFFCGNMRRDDLPAILKSENIEVTEITVYETTLTPKKLNKEYDAVLFFSPAAAESFFTNNVISPQTSLFAIGATTADAARRHTNNLIICADEPGKTELINKAINSLVSPLA